MTRYCPVCDWAVPQEVCERCVLDFDCPGCGARTLSEFVAEPPWRDREAPDPADWWKGK